MLLRKPVLLLALLLADCRQQPTNDSTETPAATPEVYFVRLTAKPVAATKVQFTVTTNAPLPVQARADVTLAGLNNDETWIGEEQDVALEKPTSTFTLDTTQNGKRLPEGQYLATVDFIRTGAGPAGSIDADLSAHQEIQLGGSGEAAFHARSKAAMQRWVMGEMDINRPWSDAELRKKLGRFERGRAESGAFTYYFPEADVTLFVAPARQKVLTFKLGRVS